MTVLPSLLTALQMVRIVYDTRVGAWWKTNKQKGSVTGQPQNDLVPQSSDKTQLSKLPCFLPLWVTRQTVLSITTHCQEKTLQEETQKCARMSESFRGRTILHWDFPMK